ncbi:polysaccharide biosynthesis/export family protein [Glaciecola sp. 1036]|uniref:polysaccharide biosynthesis/export family protein n=1 Tax=Alteromonadaceae TaxID=72275 RepID=UPI003D0134C4
MRFSIFLVKITLFYFVFIANSSHSQEVNRQQVEQNSSSQVQNAQNENEQNIDLSQFVQGGAPSIGRDQNNGFSLSQGQPQVGINSLFGHKLFATGQAATRNDGLNENYLVAPGDKIAIQLWGAVARSQVFTVDNAGNIFIPEVGPVLVKDVPAGRLNTYVTSQIKSIYPNNVNVYVNLLTATPVSVYVTGSVTKPGQYAGLASDSILFFLSSAEGVDPQSGSFRDIRILRNNEVIQKYDLYAFLINGTLDSFSFQDDDVIIVGEQKSIVKTEGEARLPLFFELTNQELNGQSLIKYARPLPNASHVAVTGTRENGPISIYVTLEEFLTFELQDGDVVLFNEDIRNDVISVQVVGSHEGPSFFTLKRGSRLIDFLHRVKIDPEDSNYGNVYIQRESVRLKQKQLLEESLQRLERSVFTAPASSNGEATIRTQEASLVAQFIERARAVEPLGKVIVSEDGKVANIRLEQSDVIVLPKNTDLIQISGEVLIPQAIVYNQNASIGDYVAWAGGFTERADDERIVIVQANGLSTVAGLSNTSQWFSEQQAYRIQPGDQILILPRVDDKIIQSIKDITQILYQIAITANVAVN